MITSYHLPALPSEAAGMGASPKVARPGRQAGAWRYDCQRRSRGTVVLAALISASLHGALLVGLARSPVKVAATGPTDVIAIRLVIPELKELEEPEPAPNDDAVATAEAPTLVPMQADLPQIPRPSDFVQQIDFSTLVERPDFSQMKLLSIPDNIRRGSGKIAERIGVIFNLADLDRIPEPIFQPAPLYPISMKREGVTANVVVEFVVDTQGRAVNAAVVESTHRGFEDAAIVGVLKWKFRAGIRGGQKVNTRMRVPIVFSFVETID